MWGEIFRSFTDYREHPFDTGAFQRAVIQRGSRGDSLRKVFDMNNCIKDMTEIVPGLPASSKDHHFIPVNRVCEIRADCLLGDEIDIHVDGLFDLVFDLHDLNKAFWPGKPDQDVDITLVFRFSPGIGTEDSDPLGTVLAQDRNNRLPGPSFSVYVLPFHPNSRGVSYQYYFFVVFIFLPENKIFLLTREREREHGIPYEKNYSTGQDATWVPPYPIPKS